MRIKVVLFDLDLKTDFIIAMKLFSEEEQKRIKSVGYNISFNVESSTLLKDLDSILLDALSNVVSAGCERWFYFDAVEFGPNARYDFWFFNFRNC